MTVAFLFCASFVVLFAAAIWLARLSAKAAASASSEELRASVDKMAEAGRELEKDIASNPERRAVERLRKSRWNRDQ